MNDQPPEQTEFVTDEDIATRLEQLETKLLTAQAMIPAMVRELQALRAQLTRT